MGWHCKIESQQQMQMQKRVHRRQSSKMNVKFCALEHKRKRRIKIDVRKWNKLPRQSNFVRCKWICCFFRRWHIIRSIGWVWFVSCLLATHYGHFLHVYLSIQMRNKSNCCSLSSHKPKYIFLVLLPSSSSSSFSSMNYFKRQAFSIAVCDYCATDYTRRCFFPLLFAYFDHLTKRRKREKNSKINKIASNTQNIAFVCVCVSVALLIRKYE